ncbi:hypothetical protein [Paraburkholderia sp. GAS42]|uniref:hypothetical protein n=1 Tax=Paraburkholderia sp. GAS42 TaxID=3035135 RepID=UPI003D2140EB
MPCCRQLEDDPQREAKLREEFHAGNPAALIVAARIEFAEGKEDRWFALMHAAFSKGSGQAAFELADNFEKSNPQDALSLYADAIERGHLGARYKIVNLLRAHPPERLGIRSDQHSASLAKYIPLADELVKREIFDVLVTGSHPVQFLEELGIPWGTGTFFLVRWKDKEFAVTARHCISASKADPNHARLIVPDRQGPVPFLGHFTPAGEEKHIDDERDIFMWEVGGHTEEKDSGWWSWRMDHLWKPASELRAGQKIFIVGYPSIEERVDYEGRKLDPHCLVIRGDLADGSLAGLLAVDCAEFEVTVDGVSGGPVFAMFDGIYFFVGMAVRGIAEARRVYFIDATHVIAAMDQAVAQLAVLASHP